MITIYRPARKHIGPIGTGFATREAAQAWIDAHVTASPVSDWDVHSDRVYETYDEFRREIYPDKVDQ